MNKIFADEIREGHVVIYLADILIFSTNLDDHCTFVAQVLQKLRLNKLYLKPEKCEFERETVDYLGMVVRGGEVRMEEKKVEVIREWLAPSRKKDLQWFLGFVNFYHKFVKDFLMGVAPTSPESFRHLKNCDLGCNNTLYTPRHWQIQDQS